MPAFNRTFALIALLLVAVGCDKKDASSVTVNELPPSQVPPPVPSFQPYAIAQDKVETLLPGLRVYIHERGTGATPKAGQRIIVHYHGTFTDGRVFDSSMNRGVPFDFVVGRGQVIQGWDEGLQRLPVGTKAALLLDPAMGYGAAGSPPVIPPNTPLVFYVEVLGISPN